MSRLFPPTLSAYLGRTYVLNFLFLTALLLGVVYLFDTVELLRRAAKFEDIPLSSVLLMGALKLPEVGQLILPFSVLFSALFTLWQMTRRYELVAIRASGLSVWQILGPMIFAAFLIGVVQVSVINPFGSILIGRFEAMENTLLKRQTSQISLSEQGLWLKQPHEQGHVVLHASKINFPAWTLDRVMVMFFDSDFGFLRRIDSASAYLEEGQWSFRDVVSNTPKALPVRSDLVTLQTDLTIADIEDSFASPETVSFWKLPSFIKTMEATGFDAVRLRLHLQSLLSQPVLYVAMILLAASVSMRPPRMSGTFLLIAGGVFIGFMVFFLSSFLQALGASHQIPVLLAAWSAPLIALLAGFTIMINLEDG